MILFFQQIILQAASGVYDDTRHKFIYGEETLNQVSQVCYEQALDLRLAQAGTVGHDVAARRAVEAGQGLGQGVRGGGYHRGGGQPVQQELALALLRIYQNCLWRKSPNVIDNLTNFVESWSKISAFIFNAFGDRLNPAKLR